MQVRYYLSPLVQISLSSRLPLASQTMLYRASDSRHSIAKFRDRDWCICRVDAGDAEHTNIQADTDIKLIPFIDGLGNYLTASDTVNQITAANRTTISNFLEARRVPTDWITGSHTIRQVLRFVIVYFNASQMLGVDFPSDFTLSQTVGDIPTARRNRIRNWMESKGIDTSDFILSMTVRQVVVRICQQLGLGAVVLGPEGMDG